MKAHYEDHDDRACIHGAPLSGDCFACDARLHEDSGIVGTAEDGLHVIDCRCHFGNGQATCPICAPEECWGLEDQRCEALNEAADAKVGGVAPLLLSLKYPAHPARCPACDSGFPSIRDSMIIQQGVTRTALGERCTDAWHLCPACNSSARWQRDKLPGTDILCDNDNFHDYAYSSGTTGYTGFKHCTHDGHRPVVNINGCDVHAVPSSTTWTKVPEYDLVLDCTSLSPRMLIVPPGLESLKRFYTPALDTIYIPWPDGQAPPLKFGFWRELVRKLPRRGRIVVTCMGAHGRTGTAIAAMILAADPAVSATAAIRLVRRQHCEEAIESKAQEDYLAAMEKARAKASKTKKAKRAVGEAPSGAQKEDA